MCDKKKVGDISVLFNNFFYSELPINSISIQTRKTEFYRLFIQVIV
jgi:hypothetical protein